MSPTDPAEAFNLAESLPDVRAALQQELRSWMRQLPAPEDAPANELSPEAAERIKSLGYVR